MIDSEGVADEIAQRQQQECISTPLKSFLNSEQLSHFKDVNASQISIGSYDPLRQLQSNAKSELIFVFSGFNDHKLLECEVFNTALQKWSPIAHIQVPRTKFAAVAISKMKILIFGGKQADGQRTADIAELITFDQHVWEAFPLAFLKVQTIKLSLDGFDRLSAP